MERPEMLPAPEVVSTGGPTWAPGDGRPAGRAIPTISAQQPLLPAITPGDDTPPLQSKLNSWT